MRPGRRASHKRKGVRPAAARARASLNQCVVQWMAVSTRGAASSVPMSSNMTSAWPVSACQFCHLKP